MRIIYLNKNYISFVDDEDYERLIAYKWSIKENRTNGRLYAATSGKHGRQLMHRIIMNAVRHQTVDHIDDNGLNNCKSNLRFLPTYSNIQRQRKRQEPRNKTSQYRGVRKKPDRRAKPWQAIISINHLGYYATEEEAAKVYDEYAVRFYGEHAFTNFPR